MSTYIPSAKEITRKWFLVDASGKTLGRLATEVASILAGKRSPKYTPYIDMGDHVIVVNAEKIVLTGMNGQISLGHGAFMALGGYVVAILAHHAGLPYWAGVVVAALPAALAQEPVLVADQRQHVLQVQVCDRVGEARHLCQ